MQHSVGMVEQVCDMVHRWILPKPQLILVAIQPTQNFLVMWVPQQRADLQQ